MEDSNGIEKACYLNKTICEIGDRVYDLKTKVRRHSKSTTTISKFYECPKVIYRPEKYDSNINPSETKVVILEQDKITQIKRDHVLYFKNIFPSRNHSNNQKIIFYYNSKFDSIILYLQSGWDTKENSALKTNDKIINSLIEKGFKELIKFELEMKRDTLKASFEISQRLVLRIFNYKWYFRIDDSSDQLWEQYNLKDNSKIEKLYKKYLLNNQEKATFDDKIINFNTNDETNIKTNKIKNIFRFCPKYSFPDKISQLKVPEEIFTKIMEDNERHQHKDEIIHFANKFGPKHFRHLTEAICWEIKNEATKLGLITQFNDIYHPLISNINGRNFMQNIVRIYTEEGFVYGRINKILREKDYSQFMGLRYYYFSLLFCLDNLNLNKQQDNQLKLYRGMNMPDKQLNFYKKLEKGQLLLF